MKAAIDMGAMTARAASMQSRLNRAWLYGGMPGRVNMGVRRYGAAQRMAAAGRRWITAGDQTVAFDKVRMADTMVYAGVVLVAVLVGGGVLAGVL